MLTSAHMALVKVALDTRSYALVAPLIAKSITYLPGSTSQPKPKYLCDMSLSPAQYITASSSHSQKLKYQEILEFFYYSGMVFTGLSNWEYALQYFEMAVTYPAKESSLSKIMVESYKKWVLVGILHEGRLPTLPRSTSQHAAKQYHVLAKPYEVLAQIFEGGTAARLKAEADQGINIWRSDSNAGLVIAVLAAYQKFQIKNLANVYSKVSIPEIYQQTTSAETGGKLANANAVEVLVQNMIQSGELHATLSTTAGQPSVVTFSITGPTLTEAQVQREMITATARIQALTKQINQTDRMLTHDKEYIKYVQKQKKNSRQGSAADQGISGADMDWNGDIEEEDLMGNVY